MKNLITILTIALILQSCCNSSEYHEYDSRIDKIFPKQQGTTVSLYNKADSSQIFNVLIESDMTSDKEYKINGDGCTNVFKERIIELDIPNTNETKFSLKINDLLGNDLTISTNYENYSLKESPIFLNQSTNFEYNDSTDFYMDEFLLNNQILQGVIQLAFDSTQSPDLDKIYFAENYGIYMITYNSGDTLLTNKVLINE